MIELPFSIARRLAAVFPSGLDLLVKVGELRFLIPSFMLKHAVPNIEHVILDGAYTKLPSFRPSPTDRVLDVGAALGFYSVIAAKEGATVVALEPQRLLARYALINAYLNGTRVRVINMALAPRAGMRSLKLYVSRNPLTSSVDPRHAKLHGGVKGIEIVKSLSLDELVELLGPFTIVKIDAECIELDVVRNSKHISDIPKVIVEAHLDCVDVDELCKALEERGFETRVFLAPEEPYQAVVYAFNTRIKSLATDNSLGRDRV